MRRHWTKFGFGVLLLLLVSAGDPRLGLACPVHRFIESYRTVANTNAPMNVFERVVYSLALAQTPPLHAHKV